MPATMEALSGRFIFPLSSTAQWSINIRKMTSAALTITTLTFIDQHPHVQLQRQTSVRVMELSFQTQSRFFCSSAIVCLWLDVSIPPHLPQVVWCHRGEIGPFSATLAQDGLAECAQSGKNPLKYSAVAGN